ncbi:MAG: transglutaminase-like domain-containing protein [Candidatus Manganitrophus sp.]|nr:transglutaminase-like domain-containing protein [Candidatus Manganitrophus sp.]
MDRSERDRTLDALVRLLGEDESHFEIIRQRLIEMGPSALPALERCAREGALQISERADQIIESIRLEALDEEWRRYAEKESCSLEEGVFLLARFAYPEMNSEIYREEINKMAAVLRRRIQPHSSPGNVIQILNHYLFEELHFSGNRENYYAPENSYINTVLETKKGIPVSLSVVMLLLAERLNLPLHGIGMPGHFLVAWSDQQDEIYIDPFNEGRMLTRVEIESQLPGDEHGLLDEYLRKVSTRQIIARMIRNLIYIYNEGGETEKGSWLERFHKWVHST